MNEMDDISIRRFEYSDRDGILKLLSLVFQQEFTPEWWKWKYELNPNGFFGEDGDIWIAEKDDEIIGHYAIIPERIKFYSKIKKIAQSVDTATHPEHRRKGIFSTLANKVYTDSKNRYPLIYGYPSEMAYKGFLKLSWKDFIIPTYFKILNYNTFARARARNNLVVWFGKNFLKIFINLSNLSKKLPIRKIKGSDVEIDKIDFFPNEINNFYEKFSKSYKIILERTQTFLNWRFSRHFGNYQIYLARAKKNNIVGYIVLNKKYDVLNITDLITLQNEDRAMFQLIDMAIKIGKTMGGNVVRCLYPYWDKRASILMKLGFNSLDSFFKLLDRYRFRFILYNNTSEKVLPNIEDWFYTLADLDS